ncbi:MAG: ATP-binding cassette domain-containing protein [Chitinivibrionales bacterium]|nr:ATP-binding cassette domain-containing protein [Chitinivibrionales bacterium]
MIVFDKVVFARGNRTILDGVSFSIAFDERVAVLGGSGEGKTTILSLIIGLQRPDSGIIRIGNDILNDKSEEELQKIRRSFAVVFQQGALFDSMTVGDNIAFPLREAGMNDPVKLEEKVRKLLGTVGVEHAIEYMPEELSGGMRRRVSIARALATERSKMFLYDEPTADLDPVNAEIIRNIINDLSSHGRGFIIVTHSVSDALLTAQRFLFLEKGSIVVDGNESSLKNVQKESVKKFVEQALKY